MPNAKGFTLVEILVVVGAIGVLTSLLLPAVQSARQSAKQLACTNNLRQIGTALHNYESARGSFPPSFVTSREENLAGKGAAWSVHARLLPYIEQASSASLIRLDLDWHNQLGAGVPAQGLSFYQCPSEPYRMARIRDGRPYVSPTNYGFAMGTWLVYDPKDGSTGNAVFGVNQETRVASIERGLSRTMAVAEVKAYQSYVRNTDDPGSQVPSSSDFAKQFPGQLKLGMSIEQNTGHTVWPDGRVHHTGFTTTFAPQTVVTLDVAGKTYDIDFNSQQEGKSSDRPTYAAVTARSHHPGSVNTLRMDGSAHAVSDGIELAIWRTLGTREAD